MREGRFAREQKRFRERIARLAAEKRVKSREPRARDEMWNGDFVKWILLPGR